MQETKPKTDLEPFDYKPTPSVPESLLSGERYRETISLGRDDAALANSCLALGAQADALRRKADRVWDKDEALEFTRQAFVLDRQREKLKRQISFDGRGKYNY